MGLRLTSGPIAELLNMGNASPRRPWLRGDFPWPPNRQCLGCSRWIGPGGAHEMWDEWNGWTGRCFDCFVLHRQLVPVAAGIKRLSGSLPQALDIVRMSGY